MKTGTPGTHVLPRMFARVLLRPPPPPPTPFPNHPRLDVDAAHVRQFLGHVRQGSTVLGQGDEILPEAVASREPTRCCVCMADGMDQ